MSSFYEVVFYELKGLTLADARCPESFYFVGLSQEGAYTSRCQMPDRVFDGVNDYIGDGLYLGDHTKSFGSSD